MKLIMTKGLPASGKSTWAKKEVLASKGETKRVNKDDLRAMIDDSLWSKTNEKHILEVRNFIVGHYLTNGFSVIVDDTNLTPNHETTLRAIAEKCEAKFEVKSFLDVPLGTCIARNAERTNPVPVNAIRSMYNSFVKHKSVAEEYVAPEFNPNMPYCIIVDIDGTLAHMTNRSPYDYTMVDSDVADAVVKDLVNTMYNTGTRDFDRWAYIIIVSGRDSSCQAETEQWLRNNNIPYDELYMRDEKDIDEKGNKLPDTVVKKGIYDKWIKPRYNVRFVLDDRKQVVDMWREQGLKVLQVQEGDF